MKETPRQLIERMQIEKEKCANTRRWANQAVGPNEEKHWFSRQKRAEKEIEEIQGKLRKYPS